MSQESTEKALHAYLSLAKEASTAFGHALEGYSKLAPHIGAGIDIESMTTFLMQQQATLAGMQEKLPRLDVHLADNREMLETLLAAAAPLLEQHMAETYKFNDDALRALAPAAQYSPEIQEAASHLRTSQLKFEGIFARQPGQSRAVGN